MMSRSTRKLKLGRQRELGLWILLAADMQQACALALAQGKLWTRPLVTYVLRTPYGVRSRRVTTFERRKYCLIGTQRIPLGLQ